MPDVPPSIWCVVANVTRDLHPEGPDGELQAGLKHFTPGAKLYCAPLRWGDGCARLRVLGRHRGGAKLVDIVIATRWLTDWRVKEVFHPHVVATMRGLGGAWVKEEAERFVAGRVEPPA